MPVDTNRGEAKLVHPNGSTVTILLYGATVISWISPGPQGNPATERLFLSSKSNLDGSKAVRGGIPVVFPIFGPPQLKEHERLAQHGFARTSVWTLAETIVDNQDEVSVRLTLTPTDSIRAVYNPAFSLSYIVALASHKLSSTLRVENASEHPLTFQALLHTYIRADSSTTSVSGLKGLHYFDKTSNQKLTEGRDVVDVKKFTDSVYQSAPGQYDVRWSGGHVSVTATGFRDVVVWNPQQEGKKIADMHDGGWNDFVCVEPGVASGFKTLQKGEVFEGQQILEIKQ